MNEIDLRRFDLNLLVVFDVLMLERSVTRAAERLGRTQSAVSHSLARLRDQLGDPLLVKGGRHMEPTAFALDFIEQARPILRSIGRVLSPRHVFDPATSRRVFRLAAPDFMLSLFTELLRGVRAEAQAVTLEWTGPRPTMLLEVAEGQVDAAIAPTGLRLPTGVVGEAVGALKWRCFARRGHPALAKWGARSWTRWPHLVVRVGDQLESPVNAAVAAAGMERTVAAWVPNFLAVAPVLGRHRSAGHAARAGDGRLAWSLWPGVPARSLSDRAASACHAVERWPVQGCRDRLVARSASTDREGQVCSYDRRPWSA